MPFYFHLFCGILEERENATEYEPQASVSAVFRSSSKPFYEYS